MSFISVFDVLGPNMIGPSSSHTAGAAAIALLAGKMPNAAIKKADFILYGSLPAHIKATEQTAPCSEGSWDFQPTTDGFRIHFLSPMSADFSIRLRQIQQKPKFTLTQ